MRRTLHTTSTHAGRRLDDVVRTWLDVETGGSLSKGAVRKLLMAGAVRVQGVVARTPGRILTSRLAIDVHLEIDRLRVGGPSALVSPSLESRSVIYEDDALIAIDKPPGLPTVPTADPARPSLVGLLADLLEARRGAGWSPVERPYLAVHHRLDRDTSGVVLFVKDPAANPGLASAFAGHEVQKVYHALTLRPRQLPPDRWRTVSHLARVGRGRHASVAVVEQGGAAAHPPDPPLAPPESIGLRSQPVIRVPRRAVARGVLAETEFVRLETWPHGLLVEARPLTGRTHQIRVHLAEAGLPILGDEVYGRFRHGQGTPWKRAMLHARRLALVHPLTGQPLTIESPYPADFDQALQSIREMSAGRDMK